MVRQKKLKVAIIAPPWLSLPVKGYGGIELVLQGLIQALTAIPSIEIVLFASGERKMRGVKTLSLFKKINLSIFMSFTSRHTRLCGHI